jgi:hypothetical protein
LHDNGADTGILLGGDSGRIKASSSSEIIGASSSAFLLKIGNNVEALEVGNALAITVSEAGESLLIDLLDLLEVGSDVALSSRLAGERELPRGLDIGLAGSELSAEAGDVSGGLGIGLLEGCLVDVASEHGVLDGTVLGGEASNLGACAGAVLSGVLIAESACTVDLGVGEERFLGVDASLVLDLLGTGLLVLPHSALLGDTGIEALENDTAFLTVLLVNRVSGAVEGTRHAQVGVRVEAEAPPVCCVFKSTGINGEANRSPFLLLFI